MVDTFKGFEWMSNDGHNGNGQWWTWVRYNFFQPLFKCYISSNFMFIYVIKLPFEKNWVRKKILRTYYKSFKNIYMCHMIWLDN
jgi:hypothetical protein